jgi:hypothetical protein
MFLVDHMCRLQKRYIVLWGKQIHTSGTAGQKYRHWDARKSYLRNHISSNTIESVCIDEVYNPIYDFHLFQ